MRVAVAGVGLLVVAGSASADTGVIGARDAAAAMSDAIASDGGKPVDAVAVARAHLAAGAVPVETLRELRRARDLIDEGWKAYQRVAIDLALARLGAARQASEPLVALPGGAEIYADASLRLGVVLAQQGRADEAHDAVALALALDPERPITLAEFSPDVLTLVDTVRATPATTQHVRVAAEPAGAIVSIDGAELGAAPLEADLPRGPHVATARAPLHVARSVGVIVDATTTSVRVELERDADAEAMAAGSVAMVEPVLRFGELDDVVLASVVVRRAQPALLVERCAGVPATCTTVVEIGYADDSGLRSAAVAAWKAVKRAERKGAPVALESGGTGTPVVHHRCELCRNPYVIAGAGAVVLGAVITIIAVSGSKPPPAVMPPPF